MIKKRYLILIFCIITILSIQFVSANDNTDNITVLGASEDGNVLQAPSETQSLSDLKNLIDQPGNEISLEYNYEYRDGNPRTGINITKNLVINGNGAIIDGKNSAGIFNISSGVTVTLKNLTIINAAGIVVTYYPVAETYILHAINSEGILNIDNCTFQDNKLGYNYQHTLEANGSVIQSNNVVNIENSIFLNNAIQNYGVVYTTSSVSVTNSRFTSNSGYQTNSKGGAIYAGSISLIENCTFESNTAKTGAAVYIADAGSVTSIKNSDFKGKDKFVANEGGAIYTNGKIDLIEGSTFDSNYAANGSAVYIGSEDSITSVTGSTFENNNGGENAYANKGAGIYTNGAIDLIEDSWFMMNWASNGGAVYIGNENSITTITDSNFMLNLADNTSGAVYTKGSIDIISGSSFESNSGPAGAAVYTKSIDKIEDSTFSDSGSINENSKGAIYIYGNNDLLITDSTFDSCQAYEGGAIFINASVTVIDSFFTGNIAHDNDASKISKGGAIYADGDVYLENVEIKNNFADYGGAIYSNGTVTIKNIDDITDNGIYDQASSLKGGVFYAKGDVDINNTIFGANIANVAGGAVYSEGNVNFYNSKVNGSAATSLQIMVMVDLFMQKVMLM